jgi:hypothetical protein
VLSTSAVAMSVLTDISGRMASRLFKSGEV